MPDHDTTLSEAELASVEAAIRAAAGDILANFDRKRISPGVALAICGIVVARLLDHAPHYHAEFIACLQGAADA